MKNNHTNYQLTRVFFPAASLLLSALLCSLPALLRAGHDTLYICVGEGVQLMADPNFATHRWRPVQGLSNPTIYNPVAVPQVTTTYIVESIPAAGDNLIINGDFSAGNTGFISDYVYSPGANPTQGVYGIFPDANNLSPNFFAHCRDHTTQTGLMMVVDGSPIVNQRVWCQTVSVTPGTTYAFSTWLTSILAMNPAALRFSINGQQIGETFVAGIQNCQWRQFYEIWDSGAATEAEICIVNQNTNPSGNDFALDDFAFFEIEAPVFDTFTVVVQPVPVTRIDTTFCAGSFVTYQGSQIPVSPAFSLTYTAASGCDSIVEYRAEILDTVAIVSRVDTLCPGEVFNWRGHLIDRDTTICELISASNGCDTSLCLQAVYLTEAALFPDITPPTCAGLRDGAIRLEVQAGLPPFQYRWEDNSTAAQRSMIGAGTYGLTVTDAKGCTAERQIAVAEPAPLSAVTDASSTYCNGTTNGVIIIEASGGVGPYQYSIDGGQTLTTDNRFSGLMPGDYEVELRDANQCDLSVGVAVPSPRTIALRVPFFSEINLGESIPVAISDNSPTPLTYEWLPADGVACSSCASTTVMPLRTTLYTIRATDAFGCSVEAQWLVEVTREGALYIPNAFSPNADGINDYFTLYPGIAVEAISDFAVYDRWGNQLFYRESCRDDCIWDGTYRGRLMDLGAYIYTARVRYLDGETVTMSGEVMLMR